VVIPRTSPKNKIDAVREHRAQVELVDARIQTPEERVRELARKHPEAYVANPDEDPFGIKGIASLGKELGMLKWGFDAIVAPIDGGALASGIILGLREARSRIPVIGAEPLAANDAARSFTAGQIVPNPEEPQTMADEARARQLGQATWPILFRSLGGIVEVREEKIAEAVRLLFELANLKTEPTGALAVAALLSRPEQFRGRSVCCVVSAANVDPGAFRTLLAA
jgi:threonine dehydratase